MRNMRRLLVLLSLGAAGCPAFTAPVPYYSGGPKPAVDGLSPASEAGSAGGQEVEISGSNFGDDPARLIVLFSQINAEILEVTDDAIRVKVPPGPLEGGAVDVRIATPTGYTVVSGGYTYDVSDIASNQRAYIVINNFTNDGLFGYAPSSGNSSQGMGGTSEAFSFAANRYHTESVAFWGSFDESTEQWTVEDPAASRFSFGVEDLREDPGPIRLHRTDVDAESTYCVDLDGTATWTSQGRVISGARTPPTEVLDGAVSCESGLEYHSNDLDFCQHLDENGVPTLTYEADWPIWNGTRPVDFFVGRAGATVELEMEEIGIGGDTAPELTLPEPLVATVDGFDSPTGWANDSIEPCLSSDVPYAIHWSPSVVKLADVEEPSGPGGAWEDGQITSARSYVRIAYDISPYGWFGLNTPLRRAVITVPDAYNVQRDEDSLVEVPREVLEQLPYFSTFPGGLGGGAQTYDTELAYGVMYLTVIRITEYAVYSSELKGDVVLSYVTGQVGFYTGWSLPSGGCL